MHLRHSIRNCNFTQEFYTQVCCIERIFFKFLDQSDCVIVVTGWFSDGAFPDERFPDEQFSDRRFPDRTFPRRDISPIELFPDCTRTFPRTDVSLTDINPTDIFPTGHFPDGLFPDQCYVYGLKN